MRNLEGLIQYLVPFSFLAIWAITSLMNRETKPVPARRPMSDLPRGRPGEPTLRWGPRRENGHRTGCRWVAKMTSSSSRPRPAARSAVGRGRRAGRAARPGQAERHRTRKLEGTSNSPLVSGVNQGVNQQLATAIDIQPLAVTDRSLVSVASRPNPPSAKAPDLVNASKLATMMVDPARLREAFLMSELLRPRSPSASAATGGSERGRTRGRRAFAPSVSARPACRRSTASRLGGDGPSWPISGMIPARNRGSGRALGADGGRLTPGSLGSFWTAPGVDCPAPTSPGFGATAFLGLQPGIHSGVPGWNPHLRIGPRIWEGRAGQTLPGLCPAGDPPIRSQVMVDAYYGNTRLGRFGASCGSHHRPLISGVAACPRRFIAT